MYTIYALIDPRDQSTRYIGMTKDVYARMRQHSRCEGKNIAKNAWIGELQKAQLMFVMRSLEHVKTLTRALEREAYWIHHFLQEGVQLLNMTCGVGIEQARENPLASLWFRNQDGQVVSVKDATDQDFDLFIKQFLRVNESGRAGWSSANRKRAIQYADRYEIHLPFVDQEQPERKPSGAKGE